MKVFSSASLLIALIIPFMVSSCKHDRVEETAGIDKELYDMAQATSGFIWYKNSDAILEKSAGSGHGEPYLRTRYNQIAAGQLDSSGKIKTGITFPEGSLVVKELIGSNQGLSRYAILFKRTGDNAADDKGWVWGYINADGSVAEPASKKGASCIGCHSQADNIDYMLMNKYFP